MPRQSDLYQARHSVDARSKVDARHSVKARAGVKDSEKALPFVPLKLAMSLDGRIATRTGHSHWISSSGSLQLVHRLRREHDAVIVGIGTVLADDPKLTVRLVPGRNPLRVIVDGRLRIPLTARVLSDSDAHSTIIATTRAADTRRVHELRQLGAGVLILPAARPEKSKSHSYEYGKAATNRVQIAGLLAALGRRRIASVLVEGGAALATSFLAAGAVDRLVLIMAPKIIG